MPYMDNEKPAQGKNHKNWLPGILSFLVILIIAQVIGIIVVENVKHSNNNQADAPVSVEESEEDEMSSYINEMSKKIADAKTDEEKVKLLQERINYLFDNTEPGAYNDQILNDTIAIDDIEQTISSAGQVINTATAYHRDDIVSKYEEIMKKRMEAEGVDTEGARSIG